MGQVPAKYMLPSAPYGQSDAVNSVNAVQPMAMNPQTPLLPPNFSDPGTTVGATKLGGSQKPASPIGPVSAGGGGGFSLQNFYANMYK